ncbi:MAG: hypothetical protein JNJ90_15415 [Saprospiraceae bacterium]|jgi:hypothetical protein|nr:hypothetical protein [Saprospiraceae bacterium]
MKRLTIFALFSLFFSACTDEEERIPAYVRVEPFTVNAIGGTGWQKITEGWVYVNDRFLGGYTLPALVPVLDEGEGDILVFPGVKENGLLQTPGLYPFLARHEGKVMLTPGQTTILQPVTQYLPEAVFPWTVDRTTFNSTTVVLQDRDGDPATTFELVTNGAFDGRSVKLAVDTAHIVNEIVTEVVGNLPNTGDRPVWLELHYRNNLPFELWLLGTDSNGSNEQAQPVYQFATSENWNKIYINLTEFLVALQKSNHRLFFRVTLQKNINGQFDQLNGEALLDNMRLVHF